MEISDKEQKCVLFCLNNGGDRERETEELLLRFCSKDKEKRFGPEIGETRLRYIRRFSEDFIFYPLSITLMLILRMSCGSFMHAQGEKV